MRSIALVSAALFTAAMSLVPAGQTAPQNRPPQPPAATFRSGVDLLTVQATVLQGARPVTNLQPGDFTVRIDGQPRKVIFARFSGARDRAAAAAPGGPALSAGHVSNATTAGGRIIMFVVDTDSIRTGSEKALLATATKLLDALTPADAVGLAASPASVGLTRTHEEVREALGKVVGTETRITSARDRHITWEEAQAFERTDRQTTARVIARECGASEPSCGRELEVYAREVLLLGRDQVRATLRTLTDAANAIQPFRGPKHLILISGGKAFDAELAGDYREFARRAAAAQVVLHTVHLDQPPDAASERRTTGSVFGGREMAAGLTTIAGMTGGGYFAAIGGGERIFERIRTEMDNFYELGVEPAASDEDGKPHDLDVSVARPGVSVRARSQVLIERTGAVAPQSALLNLLRQPVDVAEMPLAVAAYTTRGADPQTLRVLLSAELGGPSGSKGASWAFAVLDAGGNVKAEGRSDIEAAAAPPVVTTASTQLAPGRYTLRVAARDGEGRAGAIAVPLTVGLRAAGALQVSDVLAGVAVAGRMQPRSRVTQGTRLSVLVEFLSADVPALARSRAVVEIIPAGAAEPIQRHLMAARSGGADTLLLNEAVLDTTTLPPGRYAASVIALVDNEPAGRVTRTFEVTAAAK